MARQRRGDTEFLALQRTLPPAHKHIYAYESTAEFLHFSFQFRDLTDVGLIYFDSEIVHFGSNLAFTMWRATRPWHAEWRRVAEEVYFSIDYDCVYVQCFETAYSIGCRSTFILFILIYKPWLSLNMEHDSVGSQKAIVACMRLQMGFHLHFWMLILLGKA